MSRQRLDARVRADHQASWGKARGWIETGKVQVDGVTVTDPGFEVGPEARIELRMNAPRARAAAEGASPGQPPRLTRADLVEVDTQLVVVNKPAGLSTVPFKENERDTLVDQAARLVGQRKLLVVQRLDRETSGLIVFARTAEAERHLANQFRFHTTQRRYWALAHGEVRSGTIRSLLVENRGDGLRGSVRPGSAVSRSEAKEAVTHVEALRQLDGMTLIECRLETGRTHQIRIHLAEAGHPLLGEKAYHRGFAGPMLPAPRILLHAGALGVTHPARGTPIAWTRLPPGDFLAFLDARARALLEERLQKDC